MMNFGSFLTGAAIGAGILLLARALFKALRGKAADRGILQAYWRMQVTCASCETDFTATEDDVKASLHKVTIGDPGYWQYAASCPACGKQAALADEDIPGYVRSCARARND
jgi:hypothetical protein